MIDVGLFRKLGEDDLLNRVRDNTQYLFNKIWELDRERVDEAIVAKVLRLLFKHLFKISFV